MTLAIQVLPDQPEPQVRKAQSVQRVILVIQVLLAQPEQQVLPAQPEPPVHKAQSD